MLSLAPEDLLRIVFAAGYVGFAVAAWLHAKPWWATAMALAGTTWLLYSRSMLKWLSYLGSDSFSEAQNFDLAEALTFMETLTQVLRRDSFRETGVTIAMGILLLVFVYLAISRLWWRRLSATTRLAMIGTLALTLGALMVQVYPAFGAFRWNSQYYQGIYDNFHGHSHVRLTSEIPVTDLNVIVHIGESITSMNMDIYGYFRPTTPELESFAAGNENLLVFHDVLSTHTHTAPSLLEALSVGADPTEIFLPISERTRMSVIDILAQAGVPTALISNQGQSGAWNNLASTVVFRNVDEKEFSFNSAWMGEMEHFARRPLDHEFLLPALERGGHLDRPGPSVLFLHSYAGHSPYLRNIAQEFWEPVDDFLASQPEIAIVGEHISNPQHTIRRIEEYDSAVRYVDYLVTAVLRRVDASPHPAVYIFFSDHGEAVYAGRGHDSSRFLHEMVRIPFLVYFNDAAARAYPGIVEQFRAASDAQRVSTLAQFPASLLSLFGLALEGDALRGIGLEDLDRLPPILARETSAGIRYIRLGAAQPAQADAARFIELHDPHTQIFRASRQRGGRPPAMCVSRAHSVGKATRGSIIADCIHAELSIGAGGQLTITAQTDADLPVSLEDIILIAESYSTYLLFEIQSLPRPAACPDLVHALGNRPRRNQPNGLVMFPAEGLDTEAISDCIRPLQVLGFDTGIKLPTNLANACLDSTAMEELAGGPCERLRGFITEVQASTAFSDIGINASHTALIERLDPDIAFHWTVADVPVEEMRTLHELPIRRMLVESAFDPNDL